MGTCLLTRLTAYGSRLTLFDVPLIVSEPQVRLVVELRLERLAAAPGGELVGPGKLGRQRPALEGVGEAAAGIGGRARAGDAVAPLGDAGGREAQQPPHQVDRVGA